MRCGDQGHGGTSRKVRRLANEKRAKAGWIKAHDHSGIVVAVFIAPSGNAVTSGPFGFKISEQKIIASKIYKPGLING